MDFALDIKQSYLFKGVTRDAKRRYIVSDRLMALLKQGTLDYSERDMEILQFIDCVFDKPSEEWVKFCLAFARAERQMFRWARRGKPVQLKKPLTRAQFNAMALHSWRFVSTEEGYEASNRDWRLKLLTKC